MSIYIKIHTYMHTTKSYMGSKVSQSNLNFFSFAFHQLILLFNFFSFLFLLSALFSILIYLFPFSDSPLETWFCCLISFWKLLFSWTFSFRFRLPFSLCTFSRFYLVLVEIFSLMVYVTLFVKAVDAYVLKGRI